MYHESNHLALEFDGQSVITVNDLSWIHYPKMHPLEQIRVMNRYFEPGLLRAACIITDSTFKARVDKVFGVSSSLISPIPLPVGPFLLLCLKVKRSHYCNHMSLLKAIIGFPLVR